MNFDQFHAAFEKFCTELYTRLGEDDKRTWTRFNKEFYNHKMNGEVSAWWGTGFDERGYVFLATAGGWDGTVDWDRVKAIVDNIDLALTDKDTHIKVWDLAQLAAQTEARGRCSICGKLE